MSRLRPRLAVAVLAATAAAFSLAGEVLVLKGGTVIEVKQPPVRRGSTAYVTRADGTLLSMPVSEIDLDATVAANRAPAPSPPKDAPAASTPADVARVTKDSPKARVRITDADVSHPLDLGPEPTTEKDKKDQGSGSPRIEVADYTQEKAGTALNVKGTLRNVGQGSAENVRLKVSAFDEKDQAIDGAAASLSKGVIESGASVEFSASLNVGDKNIASLRFAPQWTAPRPPAPTPAARAANGASSAAAASPDRMPAPVPTPYGRGTLYAAPSANAPLEAPKDGKTGYIPGASHPDNQPKPPEQ